MAAFTALNFVIPNFTISQNLDNHLTTTTACTFTSSFLASRKSLPRYRKSSLRLNHRQSRSRLSVVASSQSDVLRVLRTAWKVGKDGVEAGTNLVPNSIPRPVARIGVAGIMVSIALFVLKSFLSTAFFVLGVMGLAYFAFIALNKDEGPRGGGGGGGGGSSEDTTLEEARRIMEKYK